METQTDNTTSGATDCGACAPSCCTTSSTIATVAPNSLAPATILQNVRETYAKAAQKVSAGGIDTTQGSSPLKGADPITRDLYSSSQVAEIPRDAFLASLGCGNPTALARLEPGQIVLDLGSGGGIDVLLSAKRVGPTGKAYGLDMTPEMLSLARENQGKAGVENAEFLEGTIENIPLPDASIDVIISNCVINLSSDKDKVLREAARVLKPGGLFAVSDIVLTRPLPEDVRKSVELWAGCVAGALLVTEYEEKLAAAGFADVTVESTRVYEAEDVKEMVGEGDSSCCGSSAEKQIAAVDGAAMSAFIRARRAA